MSYFTRHKQILIPHQVFKWNEADHPRDEKGQFTESGGGGEGGGSVSHVPISYGRGRYGIERVAESDSSKGRVSRGTTPDEFTSMEEARAHADVLNAPVRHVPINYGRGRYGIERVAETGGKGHHKALGATPEEFSSMETARAHAERLNQRFLDMVLAKKR